jgi:hypothetical protein
MSIRKTDEWTLEEQQVKLAIDGLAIAETTDRALDAQRVFELANKDYLLYVSQNSDEKAKLLRMMCSNFSVDSVTVTPTHQRPLRFDLQRAKTKEWSALVDDFRTFDPAQEGG